MASNTVAGAPITEGILAGKPVSPSKPGFPKMMLRDGPMDGLADGLPAARSLSRPSSPSASPANQLKSSSSDVDGTPSPSTHDESDPKSDKVWHALTNRPRAKEKAREIPFGATYLAQIASESKPDIGSLIASLSATTPSPSTSPSASSSTSSAPSTSVPSPSPSSSSLSSSSSSSSSNTPSPPSAPSISTSLLSSTTSFTSSTLNVPSSPRTGPDGSPSLSRRTSLPSLLSLSSGLRSPRAGASPNLTTPSFPMLVATSATVAAASTSTHSSTTVPTTTTTTTTTVTTSSSSDSNLAVGSTPSHSPSPSPSPPYLKTSPSASDTKQSGGTSGSSNNTPTTTTQSDLTVVDSADGAATALLSIYEQGLARQQQLRLLENQLSQAAGSTLNILQREERCGNVLSATVQRVRQTRKFLLSRITNPRWEVMHHYHTTALEHSLGRKQPNVMEVAEMLSGHLTLYAMARRTTLSQKALIFALNRAKKQRNEASERVKEIYKRLRDCRNEAREVEQLLDETRTKVLALPPQTQSPAYNKLQRLVRGAGASATRAQQVAGRGGPANVRARYLKSLNIASALPSGLGIPMGGTSGGSTSTSTTGNAVVSPPNASKEKEKGKEQGEEGKEGEEINGAASTTTSPITVQGTTSGGTNSSTESTEEDRKRIAQLLQALQTQLKKEVSDSSSKTNQSQAAKSNAFATEYWGPVGSGEGGISGGEVGGIVLPAIQLSVDDQIDEEARLLRTGATGDNDDDLHPNKYPDSSDSASEATSFGGESLVAVSSVASGLTPSVGPSSPSLSVSSQIGSDVSLGESNQQDTPFLPPHMVPSIAGSDVSDTASVTSTSAQSTTSPTTTPDGAGPSNKPSTIPRSATPPPQTRQSRASSAPSSAAPPIRPVSPSDLPRFVHFNRFAMRSNSPTSQATNAGLRSTTPVASRFSSQAAQTKAKFYSYTNKPGAQTDEKEGDDNDDKKDGEMVNREDGIGGDKDGKLDTNRYQREGSTSAGSGTQLSRIMSDGNLGSIQNQVDLSLLTSSNNINNATETTAATTTPTTRRSEDDTLLNYGLQRERSRSKVLRLAGTRLDDETIAARAEAEGMDVDGLVRTPSTLATMGSNPNQAAGTTGNVAVTAGAPLEPEESSTSSDDDDDNSDDNNDQPRNNLAT